MKCKNSSNHWNIAEVVEIECNKNHVKDFQKRKHKVQNLKYMEIGNLKLKSWHEQGNWKLENGNWKCKTLKLENEKWKNGKWKSSHQFAILTHAFFFSPDGFPKQSRFQFHSTKGSCGQPTLPQSSNLIQGKLGNAKKNVLIVVFFEKYKIIKNKSKFGQNFDKTLIYQSKFGQNFDKTLMYQSKFGQNFDKTLIYSIQVSSKLWLFNQSFINVLKYILV